MRATVLGESFTDPIVPTGAPYKERQWKGRHYHAHPVGRSDAVAPIADLHGFVYMAAQVLYGRECDAVKFAKVNRRDAFATQPDDAVHAALPCFYEFARGTLRSDKVFNLDKLIHQCCTFAPMRKHLPVLLPTPSE